MKHPLWNKELDDKLLAAVAMGKNYIQLENILQLSHPTIIKRLKEMGFDNLRDARKVMTS
jgi:hypothetical protein